jgi:hypothetical protein
MMLKSLTHQPWALFLAISLSSLLSSTPGAFAGTREDLCAQNAKGALPAEVMEAFRKAVPIAELTREQLIYAEKKASLNRLTVKFLAKRSDLRWTEKVELYRLFTRELQCKGAWSSVEAINQNSVVFRSILGNLLIFLKNGEIFRLDIHVSYPHLNHQEKEKFYGYLNEADYRFTFPEFGVHKVE